MDNQKAIRLMRNLPTMCEFTDAYGEPIDSDAYYEAVDMAISALEAQDTPDTNVDTISRCAAIEEMDNIVKKTKEGFWEPAYIPCVDVFTALKQLPSAQPERCSDCIVHGGDWECDHMHCRKGRLPSAQPDLTAEDWKLIKQLRSCHNGSYARVLDRMIAAASQPAIIHCRDCKHYYFADNRIPQEQRYTCDLDGHRWSPDSFCSYAERREE